MCEFVYNTILDKGEFVYKQIFEKKEFAYLGHFYYICL